MGPENVPMSPGEPMAPRESALIVGTPEPACAPASAGESARVAGWWSGLSDAALRRWGAVVRWLEGSTFSPAWLPPHWRHLAVGYVSAVLLQGVAALAVIGLRALRPDFTLRGVLLLPAVMLVAFLWGAGPSVVATLAGAALVGYVLLPPSFAWSHKEADLVGVAVYVLVGLAVGYGASQSERARRRAEEAWQQRDAFLALASHELKSPLTVIQANAQLVQRRLQAAAREMAAVEQLPADEVRQLIAQARRLVGTIEKSGRRTERLVDELLDVTRIETGELEVHPVPSDLAAIVRDCTEEQQRQQPNRVIRLDVPDAPAPVIADADRIDQVLANYLSNALKYSPGERRVEVSLAMIGGGQARVAVRDEGPGLPLAERERVWERSHRVPGVRVVSGSGVGLGLGLHICKSIVERHGGAVGVDSEVGRGSTFWFTLPLALLD
jgi:signal transduction histidine kinase